MSILDSILTNEQKEAGLYMLERTKGFAYLMRDRKVIAYYPADSVTIDQIRHDADQIIEWDKSGISFERVK